MTIVPLSGDNHSAPIRVYWEDTDAGGVVYHASYVRFMERGRTEFLRALGLTQTELHAQTGVLFVVRKITLDYLAPSILDDLLEVRTQVSAIGGASLTFIQHVMREGTLLAAAEVVCVCVGSDKRPARVPETLRSKFSETVQQTSKTPQP